MSNPSKSEKAALAFIARVADRSCRIGIIGMGYVGLPLAVAFGKAGFSVLAFDIDPAKAVMLNNGDSYIKHVAGADLKDLRGKELLEATADMARLEAPDVLIVCVPTPLTQHNEPDLKFIERTAESIAERLRKSQLVVLESTTYPGTTRDVLVPILESGRLRTGVDFFVAYSPEREDPGNERFNTSSTPKVVGADDKLSRDMALALYGSIVNETVPVSSAATAEAVKITENIFRAVNIALVNELKLVYEAMGVDVWEVIEAAKTKPFGFMPFYPGPGLGGHCIPIDPFYLTWKAREFGQHTRFIELAGQINSAMPMHVLNVLAEALDARFKRGLNGSRILVLGVAYKKNVDDTRESPALKLIELIEARGAHTDYYDPHVSELGPLREHPRLTGRHSIEWDLDALASYDAVLIVTNHDCVDYEALTSRAKLVVDTRNACARAGGDLTKVVRA